MEHEVRWLRKQGNKSISTKPKSCTAPRAICWMPKRHRRLILSSVLPPCRDPERIALAYTEDTEWRNRAEFVKGRDAVREVRWGW